MSAFYEMSKSLLRKVVPAGLLFRLELPLRKWYAIAYRGDEVNCNICQSHLSSFISLEKGDLLCPVCGSLPRHRRLWFLLQENRLEGQVLHFSPSRPLLRQLSKAPGIQYVPSDYESNPLVQLRLDITAIDFENNHFDLVICYHVLEHIPEDQKAMSELYRVLKPGGKVLVQTPFKEGAIYENATIKSAAERLKHFGQEDHVRVYSLNGLKQRLAKAGFKVEILSFLSEVAQNELFGLDPKEQILVCQK